MHLGLIGYGSIAQSLIALLPDTRVRRVTVLVRTPAVAPVQTPEITFVTSLDALLAAQPSLVVECAGHGAVADHANDILGAGTDLLVASLGAFADAALHTRVLQTCAKTGARLILPTGAIGGLDLLRVLSANGDVHVTYRGIKPPAAWRGSPADTLVDLDHLQSRTAFFKGSGRAAAAQFPKNANVVAALALAGAGFDTMKVALIADPAARANTHSFAVTSPLCSYKTEIENAATSGNARTSKTTVLSILHEVLHHNPLTNP